MESLTKQHHEQNNRRIKDILTIVKWGNISKDYFGYSRGWFYQRLNGYDGNGNPCEFTDEQKETLREALRDLSKRIAAAAENI